MWVETNTLQKYKYMYVKTPGGKGWVVFVFSKHARMMRGERLKIK